MWTLGLHIKHSGCCLELHGFRGSSPWPWVCEATEPGQQTYQHIRGAGTSHPLFGTSDVCVCVCVHGRCCVEVWMNCGARHMVLSAVDPSVM